MLNATSAADIQCKPLHSKILYFWQRASLQCVRCFYEIFSLPVTVHMVELSILTSGKNRFCHPISNILNKKKTLKCFLDLICNSNWTDVFHMLVVNWGTPLVSGFWGFWELGAKYDLMALFWEFFWDVQLFSNSQFDDFRNDHAVNLNFLF